MNEIRCQSINHVIGVPNGKLAGYCEQCEESQSAARHSYVKFLIPLQIRRILVYAASNTSHVSSSLWHSAHLQKNPLVGCCPPTTDVCWRKHNGATLLVCTGKKTSSSTELATTIPINFPPKLLSPSGKRCENKIFSFPCQSHVIWSPHLQCNRNGEVTWFLGDDNLCGVEVEQECIKHLLQRLHAWRLDHHDANTADIALVCRRAVIMKMPPSSGPFSSL